jgi:succinate dehydrogenase / fumarate reductase iron-sulfur subunit
MSSGGKNLRLTLEVWRQPSPDAAGRFETYQLDDVSADISFLEMLDQLNERLIKEGKDPVAFEHDCREGICGSCGFMINGQAHGPLRGTTVCQLHMRHFHDGERLVLEPWRASAFPVRRDLVVDRDAFDRIMAKGGYNSTRVGNAPEANSILVGKETASKAFDAATCIACGACVAACKNGSALLFVSAKNAHLGLLPQGAPERYRRAVRMVEQMEAEGFGGCSNTLECEAACPKQISTGWIQRMTRDYIRGKTIESTAEVADSGGG